MREKYENPYTEEVEVVKMPRSVSTVISAFESLFDQEVHDFVAAVTKALNDKLTNEILNMNPLTFWKDNQFKLPRLAKVAI